MPKIVCHGYGSSHGFAKGRMWFACGACRWYRKPDAPRTEAELKALLDQAPRYSPQDAEDPH